MRRMCESIHIHIECFSNKQTNEREKKTLIAHKYTPHKLQFHLKQRQIFGAMAKKVMNSFVQIRRDGFTNANFNRYNASKKQKNCNILANYKSVQKMLNFPKYFIFQLCFNTY